MRNVFEKLSTEEMDRNVTILNLNQSPLVQTKTPTDTLTANAANSYRTPKSARHDQNPANHTRSHTPLKPLPVSPNGQIPSYNKRISPISQASPQSKLASSPSDPSRLPLSPYGQIAAKVPRTEISTACLESTSGNSLSTPPRLLPYDETSPNTVCLTQSTISPSLLEPPALLPFNETAPKGATNTHKNVQTLGTPTFPTARPFETPCQESKYENAFNMYDPISPPSPTNDWSKKAPIHEHQVKDKLYSILTLPENLRAEVPLSRPAQEFVSKQNQCVLPLDNHAQAPLTALPSPDMIEFLRYLKEDLTVSPDYPERARMITVNEEYEIPLKTTCQEYQENAIATDGNIFNVMPTTFQNSGQLTHQLRLDHKAVDDGFEKSGGAAFLKFVDFPSNLPALAIKDFEAKDALAEWENCIQLDSDRQHLYRTNRGKDDAEVDQWSSPNNVFETDLSSKIDTERGKINEANNSSYIQESCSDDLLHSNSNEMRTDESYRTLPTSEKLSKTVWEKDIEFPQRFQQASSKEKEYGYDLKECGYQSNDKEAHDKKINPNLHLKSEGDEDSFQSTKQHRQNKRLFRSLSSTPISHTKTESQKMDKCRYPKLRAILDKRPRNDTEIFKKKKTSTPKRNVCAKHLRRTKSSCLPKELSYSSSEIRGLSQNYNEKKLHGQDSVEPSFVDVLQAIDLSCKEVSDQRSKEALNPPISQCRKEDMSHCSKEDMNQCWKEATTQDRITGSMLSQTRKLEKMERQSMIPNFDTQNIPEGLNARAITTENSTTILKNENKLEPMVEDKKAKAEQLGQSVRGNISTFPHHTPLVSTPNWFSKSMFLGSKEPPADTASPNGTVEESSMLAVSNTNNHELSKLLRTDGDKETRQDRMEFTGKELTRGANSSIELASRYVAMETQEDLDRSTDKNSAMQSHLMCEDTAKTTHSYKKIPRVEESELQHKRNFTHDDNIIPVTEGSPKYLSDGLTDTVDNGSLRSTEAKQNFKKINKEETSSGASVLIMDTSMLSDSHGSQKIGDENLIPSSVVLDLSRTSEDMNNGAIFHRYSFIKESPETIGLDHVNNSHESDKMRSENSSFKLSPIVADLTNDSDRLDNMGDDYMLSRSSAIVVDSATDEENSNVEIRPSVLNHTTDRNGNETSISVEKIFESKPQSQDDRVSAEQISTNPGFCPPTEQHSEVLETTDEEIDVVEDYDPEGVFIKEKNEQYKENGGSASGQEDVQQITCKKVRTNHVNHAQISPLPYTLKESTNQYSSLLSWLHDASESSLVSTRRDPVGLEVHRRYSKSLKQCSSEAMSQHSRRLSTYEMNTRSIEAMNSTRRRTHEMSPYSTEAMNQPNTHEISHCSTKDLNQPIKQEMSRLSTEAMNQRSVHEMRQLSTEAMNQRSVHEMRQLSTEAMNQRSVHEMRQLSTEAMKPRSVHEMSQLSTEAMNQRSVHEMSQLSTEAMNQRSVHEMRQLSTEVMNQRSVHEMRQLSTEAMNQRSVHEMRQLSTEAMNQRSVHEMSQLSTEAMKPRSVHEMRQLSTEAINQCSTRSSPHEVSEYNTEAMNQRSAHEMSHRSSEDLNMHSKHEMSRCSTESKTQNSMHEMSGWSTEAMNQPIPREMSTEAMNKHGLRHSKHEMDQCGSEAMGQRSRRRGTHEISSSSTEAIYHGSRHKMSQRSTEGTDHLTSRCDEEAMNRGISMRPFSSHTSQRNAENNTSRPTDTKQYSEGILGQFSTNQIMNQLSDGDNNQGNTCDMNHSTEELQDQNIFNTTQQCNTEAIDGRRRCTQTVNPCSPEALNQGSAEVLNQCRTEALNHCGTKVLDQCSTEVVNQCKREVVNLQNEEDIIQCRTEAKVQFNVNSPKEHGSASKTYVDPIENSISSRSQFAATSSKNVINASEQRVQYSQSTKTPHEPTGQSTLKSRRSLVDSTRMPTTTAEHDQDKIKSNTNTTPQSKPSARSSRNKRKESQAVPGAALTSSEWDDLKRRFVQHYQMSMLQGLGASPGMEKYINSPYETYLTAMQTACPPANPPTLQQHGVPFHIFGEPHTRYPLQNYNPSPTSSPLLSTQDNRQSPMMDERVRAQAYRSRGFPADIHTPVTTVQQLQQPVQDPFSSRRMMMTKQGPVIYSHGDILSRTPPLGHNSLPLMHDFYKHLERYPSDPNHSATLPYISQLIGLQGSLNPRVTHSEQNTLVPRDTPQDSTRETNSLTDQQPHLLGFQTSAANIQAPPSWSVYMQRYQQELMMSYLTQHLPPQTFTNPFPTRTHTAGSSDRPAQTQQSPERVPQSTDCLTSSSTQDTPSSTSSYTAPFSRTQESRSASHTSMMTPSPASSPAVMASLSVRATKQPIRVQDREDQTQQLIGGRGGEGLTQQPSGTFSEEGQTQQPIRVHGGEGLTQKPIRMHGGKGQTQQPIRVHGGETHTQQPIRAYAGEVHTQQPIKENGVETSTNVTIPLFEPDFHTRPRQQLHGARETYIPKRSIHLSPSCRIPDTSVGKIAGSSFSGSSKLQNCVTSLDSPNNVGKIIAPPDSQQTLRSQTPEKTPENLSKNPVAMPTQVSNLDVYRNETEKMNKDGYTEFHTPLHIAQMENFHRSQLPYSDRRSTATNLRALDPTEMQSFRPAHPLSYDVSKVTFHSEAAPPRPTHSSTNISQTAPAVGEAGESSFQRSNISSQVYPDTRPPFSMSNTSAQSSANTEGLAYQKPEQIHEKLFKSDVAKSLGMFTQAVFTSPTELSSRAIDESLPPQTSRAAGDTPHTRSTSHSRERRSNPVAFERPRDRHQLFPADDRLKGKSQAREHFVIDPNMPQPPRAGLHPPNQLQQFALSNPLQQYQLQHSMNPRLQFAFNPGNHPLLVPAVHNHNAVATTVSVTAMQQNTGEPSGISSAPNLVPHWPSMNVITKEGAFRVGPHGMRPLHQLPKIAAEHDSGPSKQSRRGRKKASR